MYNALLIYTEYNTMHYTKQIFFASKICVQARFKLQIKPIISIIHKSVFISMYTAVQMK